MAGHGFYKFEPKLTIPKTSVAVQNESSTPERSDAVVSHECICTFCSKCTTYVGHCCMLDPDCVKKVQQLSSGVCEEFLDENWELKTSSFQKEVTCVTQIDELRNIVLHPTNLFSTLVLWANNSYQSYPDIEKLESNQLRFASYKNVTYYLRGPLKQKNRKPLPKCVVGLIRARFPDPNNDYTGFQDAQK